MTKTERTKGEEKLQERGRSRFQHGVCACVCVCVCKVIPHFQHAAALPLTQIKSSYLCLTLTAIVLRGNVFKCVGVCVCMYVCVCAWCMLSFILEQQRSFYKLMKKQNKSEEFCHISDRPCCFFFPSDFDGLLLDHVGRMTRQIPTGDWQPVT